MLAVTKSELILIREALETPEDREVRDDALAVVEAIIKKNIQVDGNVTYHAFDDMDNVLQELGDS